MQDGGSVAASVHTDLNPLAEAQSPKHPQIVEVAIPPSLAEDFALTKQLLDANPTVSLRNHLDAEARAQVMGLLTTRSKQPIARTLRRKGSDSNG